MSFAMRSITPSFLASVSEIETDFLTASSAQSTFRFLFSAMDLI